MNLYLITTVTGLAEAAHFAAVHGLDMDTFRAVLDAGPMASTVSRGKLAKLLADDLSPQAAAADVLVNNELVAAAARAAGMASPALDVSHALFGEAVAQGHGGEDMIAVIRALEARTSDLGQRRGSARVSLVEQRAELGGDRGQRPHVPVHPGEQDRSLQGGEHQRGQPAGAPRSGSPSGRSAATIASSHRASASRSGALTGESPPARSAAAALTGQPRSNPRVLNSRFHGDTMWVNSPDGVGRRAPST